MIYFTPLGLHKGNTYTEIEDEDVETLTKCITTNKSEVKALKNIFTGLRQMNSSFTDAQTFWRTKKC